MKTRISMIIEEDIWSEFKKRTAEKKLSASFVVRRLIEQFNTGKIDISVELKHE